MRNYKNFGVFFLVVLVFSCKPTIIAYEASQPKSEKFTNYLSYYLPKSYLKVKVPIEKNEIKEGLIHKLEKPLKEQITKFFVLNFGWDTIKIEEKFSLGKQIQFIPLTVPDTNKHYTIAFKNAETLAQTLNLKLNEEGIISSGEFAQENKTFEFVSKGLELGATLAGNFFSLGVGEPGELVFGFTDNSDEFKRIEILTEELVKIIRNRSDIITQNSAGISKEAIEYRVTQIDQRIAAIKKEIMGSEKTTIHWASFIYEPKTKTETVTILELDHENGITIPNAEEKNVLSYINNSTPSNAKKLSIMATSYSPNFQQPDSTLNKKSNEKPTKTNGFLRYNKPPKYTLQLLWDGKPLKTFKDSEYKKGVDVFTMFFPQNGSIEVLPGNFKDANIIFYDDIGGIKEIKFAKKNNLDATIIQSSFAAADSLISLRKTVKEYNSKDETDNEETEEAEETIIRLIIEDGDIPQSE